MIGILLLRTEPFFVSTCTAWATRRSTCQRVGYRFLFRNFAACRRERMAGGFSFSPRKAQAQALSCHSPHYKLKPAKQKPLVEWELSKILPRRASNPECSRWLLPRLLSLHPDERTPTRYCTLGMTMLPVRHATVLLAFSSKSRTAQQSVNFFSHTNRRRGTGEASLGSFDATCGTVPASSVNDCDIGVTTSASPSTTSFRHFHCVR